MEREVIIYVTEEECKAIEKLISNILNTFDTAINRYIKVNIKIEDLKK